MHRLPIIEQGQLQDATISQMASKPSAAVPHASESEVMFDVHWRGSHHTI